MKIRNRVDLIQTIDDDYTWRRIEINTLLDMLRIEGEKPSSRRNKHKINCLIKSIVCISYSHWEGFAKYASRVYLEYIQFLSLDNSKLSNNLKAAFTAFLRNNIPLIERVETFRQLFTNVQFKHHIPVNELTNTHDNLNYEFLVELACNIDFDYSEFVTKEKFIDGSLLNYRNKFAHGEANYEVDIDKAKDIARNTLSLISIFKDEIENMISLEKYKNG